MSIRCRVCGRKVGDLRRMGGSKIFPRVYCSKDCRLIGDLDYNISAIFLYLLIPPLLPIPIYLVIKGRKLKKQREREIEEKKNLCFYCKKEVGKLQEGKNLCMSCGNPINFCDLCQKHVFANEKTLQVEPCGHIFHKSEFLDWSEENTVCPKCGDKVELVDYDPE